MLVNAPLHIFENFQLDISKEWPHTFAHIRSLIVYNLEMGSIS